ncbi:heavy metal translocating P-type ATPase [Halobellus limi]|uniref:Cation-transporting P-type ATPase n=1 Tax=Halobellus limi TaxID=699433 RepID=A0A1H5WFY3_9EURY|nr:cation-translocating P-type ATPase [Halobellus limi]QCC46459.1 cation-transporting P-type ATPase [Halobellus limi]SEF98186.1 Cd2+/Zn2+-exporting ATPase [Halobellus limi]
MTDDRDPVGQPTGEGRREVTVRLVVPEMDCPSCAGKVDKSLDRVEGIVDTTLQPTTGTASVTYDPDRVSEADLIDAIEGAGYEVVAGGGSEDGTAAGSGPEASAGGVDVAPPAEVWTSPRAIKTWIGAVFVTLGLLFEFVLAGQNPAVASVLAYPLHLADVLFLVAIAVSGYPVVRGGYYSARNRSLDIDLLMGTAIIAATGIGYFVEAATLAVLFSVAELLEDYSMDRARDSLRELMELSPDEATVRRDSDAAGDSGETAEEVTVPAEEVAVGETVIVRPGEKIPLDGVVREGESAVDESPITGESVPVDKTEGAAVYAGSINTEGYLEVEVTSTAGDSTLSRIIEMVQGAQEKQTDKEQFVDRFAGYYTPAVVVLAILTAAVPPLLIADPVSVGAAGYAITFVGDWGTWFVRGLTLLVIACPCAFVISTPVSVVSGITSAAKNGVLIKGGNHLEAMGEVDAVAFDKTGTLTRGELAVTDVVAFGDRDEDDVLRYAAGLERRSEHPIASAILARSEEAGIENPPSASDFESFTGKGVRADVDGETFYAGNPALFEELGFDLTASQHRTDGGALTGRSAGEDVGDVLADLEHEGKTVVLVGTETELLGTVAIADEVRPGARRTVERLHELGVEHVVMLTGDNEGTARAIAEDVGVDEYRAELLPEEKVEAIEEIRDAHGDVAMVGDGVNDAPALATADVGVAMGAAGTDTALETADIALMGDDIGKLPYLYALSHTANGVIRQNIWASLAVKALLALGVPLGFVSVAVAVVVGDMGMSLGVTGNAMRLAGIDPERFA